MTGDSGVYTCYITKKKAGTDGGNPKKHFE